MAAPLLTPAWSPSETLNVIGALGTLLVTLTASIVALVKSFHNESKADSLADRINSQANSIRENRNATTQIALAMPSSGGTGAQNTVNVDTQAQTPVPEPDPVPLTDPIEIQRQNLLDQLAALPPKKEN